MRSKVLLLLVVLLVAPALVVVGCGWGIDSDTSRKFLDAQRAFDQATGPDEFCRVARKYQEILDRGVTSGAVLYNQGNAWMNGHRPGQAIAAYRQAKRYRPTDPQLDANLQYALGGNAPASPRRPIVEHIFFWQNWLSYPAKFYLAATAAAITFLCGTLALFIYRRLFARLAIAGLVVTGLLIFSAGYDWYRFDHIVHGVVDTDEVVARKGNAETYEPAFTEPIPEGTEFRMLNQRGDWLLIRLIGGQEGWIPEGDAVVY